MFTSFFDFYSYKNYGFVFSACLTIITIVGYLSCGMNLGIDFKGGVIIELNSKYCNEITNVLNLKCENIIIQELDKNLVITLQTKDCSALKTIDIIKHTILQIDSEVIFLKSDFVGPKISIDSVNKSILAFCYSLLTVIIYIIIRFDWRFGIGALLSLLHDIVASIGFFVLTRYEFNLTSVAAILTIIGYSINDSIVIYDRIRENIFISHKQFFMSVIINKSINETLSRTVMTFFTTFVTCVVLFIFGGDNLKSFGAIMAFGIAFGTYSSIFISANILPSLPK